MTNNSTFEGLPIVESYRPEEIVRCQDDLKIGVWDLVTARAFDPDLQSWIDDFVRKGIPFIVTENKKAIDKNGKYYTAHIMWVERKAG